MSSDKLSPDYEVLTTDQVVNLMNVQIEKVQEIAKIPNNQLRVLLTKNRWDIDIFLEQFFDGKIELPETRMNHNLSQQSLLDDPPKENDRLKKSSRKSSRKRKSSLVLVEPVRKLRSKVEEPKICEICFDSCLESTLSEMECGQKICKNCFKIYLHTTIYQNFSLDCIRCPCFECNHLLSDNLVLDKIDADMKSKYQQLITNGFVQNSRLIKWCTSVECERAIKVSVTNQPAVRCECGSYFCFQCLQEIHDLIPCKLLKDFADVKAAHLETASWLVSNTKLCPRCQVNIEKIGGCNHITCSFCHFEFCWICCSDWNIHIQCVASQAVILNSSQMRRLVDCNTKHQTMVQSIKLDENKYKTQLHDQELEIKDQCFKIDFVHHAVEVLLLCRRSLADSFIFAYFHLNETDTQWILFELNQSALLKAAEDLSHVLETQVNADNIHMMKRVIKDKVTYCKGLHRALFDHVREGFENDVWQKITD